MQRKLDKVRKQKADLQKKNDSGSAEHKTLQQKVEQVEEAPIETLSAKSQARFNASMASLAEDQDEEGVDDPDWYIENLPDIVLGSGCKS